jgi:hypothetical protein
MNEPHKSALTSACEVHNTLEAEVMLAEQYYNIAPCILRDRVNAKRQRLRVIKQHVSSCVNIALAQLRAANIDTDGGDEPWYVSDDAHLECPWTSPPATTGIVARLK